MHMQHPCMSAWPGSASKGTVLTPLREHHRHERAMVKPSK